MCRQIYSNSLKWNWPLPFFSSKLWNVMQMLSRICISCPASRSDFGKHAKIIQLFIHLSGMFNRLVVVHQLPWAAIFGVFVSNFRDFVWKWLNVSEWSIWAESRWERWKRGEVPIFALSRRRLAWDWQTSDWEIYWEVFFTHLTFLLYLECKVKAASYLHRLNGC